MRAVSRIKFVAMLISVCYLHEVNTAELEESLVGM